jgi:Flp pilus assembly pilin Flp
VFAKLAEMLRGARRVELMVILALIAVLILASASYDRADAGATALETRLERALEAVKGAGDVRVMITENGDGGVVGVLVVAEGAGDISVRLDIMYAVRTLMGIDADQVEIAQMRGDHK